MKKFVFTSILFLTPLSIYMCFNMIFNYYVYSNKSIDLENAKVVVLGDSHLMTAIDPDLFENATNVCQSAEPPIVSYWKLKKILQANTPDQIIFGFAPHNISECNDYKFCETKWSKEIFNRIYPIQDFSSIRNKLSVDYSNYYHAIWKQTALFPKMIHANYIGKFSAKMTSDISNWQSAIKRHYYLNDQVYSESVLSVAYIDSIVDICRKNDVLLLIASSPVHKRYYENIPRSILDSYNKLIEKYEEQGVFVYNKIKDSSYADSMFFDAHHLNYVGAKRFTSELIEFHNKSH